LIAKQPLIAKLPLIAKRRRYSGGDEQAGSFEVLDGDRSRVNGSLHFTTVSELLTAGVEAVNNGRAAVIDLAGVTASDSSVWRRARIARCATKIFPTNYNNLRA